jgi:hypothetical protein
MKPPRIGTFFSSGPVVYSKSGSGLQYLLALMTHKKEKKCPILKSCKIFIGFSLEIGAPHFLL